MASIGSLTASLELESGAFIRNMERSRRALGEFNSATNRTLRAVEARWRQFDRSINRSISAMGALRTAVASVAGSAGLGLLVRRSIEAADGIAKTADRVGVGVEALQELRHAAELSGVGANVLEMSLQRLTRRVGEAANGSNEAQALFARLGVSIRDAEGAIRPTEAILSDIADRMRDYGTAAERTTAAQKLFDSEGVSMVNMLRGGADALEQMRAQAQELGLVLDEDLIRGAETTNDRLTVLSRVIEARFNRAVLESADNIDTFAERVSNALPAVFRFFSGAIEYAEHLARVVERIMEAGRAIGRWLGTDQFGEWLRGQQEAEDERPGPRITITRGQRPQPALPPRPSPVTRAARTGRTDAEREAEAIARTVEALEFQQQQLMRTERAQAQYNALARAGIDINHEAAASIMESAGRLYDLGEASRMLDEIIAEDSAGFFGRELERIGEEARTVSDEFARFGEITSSAFEDAILNGAKLKDVLGGLLQDFARMGLRSASNSIFGAIGGFLGFGGGGVSSALDSSIASNPDLFGFANGGSFRVGGAGGTDSQLVAFRATPGEMVDVRTPGQQRDGGITFAPVINAPGADAAQLRRVEAKLDEMHRDLPRIIDGKVLDGRRRLGAYDTTFAR